eukprot:m51a1_g12884 hypothetical protein (205) ;mRNA; r:2290-2970
MSLDAERNAGQPSQQSKQRPAQPADVHALVGFDLPGEAIEPPELAEERSALRSERERERLILAARAQEQLERHRAAQASVAAGTAVVQVERGDTVQGIALRHGCTASDVRRLNGLGNDDELCARSFVRVPGRSSAGGVPQGEGAEQLTPEQQEERVARVRGGLVSEFRRRCAGAGEEEAKSYLSMSDWELDRAVSEFKADLSFS